MMDLPPLRICIKGAGDLATGVALRLFRAGMGQILLLEKPTPMAVRRRVAFSEAVYLDEMTVEGVPCQRIGQVQEAEAVWSRGALALLIDPTGSCLERFHPDVLVDAIVAKTNLGTAMHHAPLTIGLGPGFTAGEDVHCVIETHRDVPGLSPGGLAPGEPVRGEQASNAPNEGRAATMGQVITAGQAHPNTGIPGTIAGKTAERLLRAPCEGLFATTREIGERVSAGELVATVDGRPVLTRTGGVLRGLLRDQTIVLAGCKLGDVDPRGDVRLCDQVSDKALAVGGGVLKAIRLAMGGAPHNWKCDQHPHQLASPLSLKECVWP